MDVIPCTLQYFTMAMDEIYIGWINSVHISSSLKIVNERFQGIRVFFKMMSCIVFEVVLKYFTCESISLIQFVFELFNSNYGICLRRKLSVR